MTVIRIGRPLRDYFDGMDPDPDEDPDLYELIDYIQGHSTYPAGIDLPEKFWSDVWYYADLLDNLDPSPGEHRAAQTAMADLVQAGFTPWTRRAT